MLATNNIGYLTLVPRVHPCDHLLINTACTPSDSPHGCIYDMISRLCHASLHLGPPPLYLSGRYSVADLCLQATLRLTLTLWAVLKGFLELAVLFLLSIFAKRVYKKWVRVLR